MAFTVDPFTQCETALWAMLEGLNEFKALVKQGNRIKFNDDNEPDPGKTIAQDGDFPLCLIRPSGIESDLWETIGSAVAGGGAVRIEQDFMIRIVETDLRTHRKFNKLKWVLIKALVSGDLETTDDFIKGLKLSSMAESPEELEDFGIKGWTFDVVVTMTLIINHSDMEVS